MFDCMNYNSSLKHKVLVLCHVHRPFGSGVTTSPRRSLLRALQQTTVPLDLGNGRVLNCISVADDVPCPSGQVPKCCSGSGGSQCRDIDNSVRCSVQYGADYSVTYCCS